MNISKEYDRLYEESEKLFKEYNPCGVKDGKCAGKYGRDWCCSGCKHLGKNGCRVKALLCKLWLCYTRIQSNDIPAEFRRRRRDLVTQAADLGLMHYRCSKAESLRRRKAGYKFSREHGWFNM